jgi:hypothetical protein
LGTSEFIKKKLWRLTTLSDSRSKDLKIKIFDRSLKEDGAHPYENVIKKNQQADFCTKWFSFAGSCACRPALPIGSLVQHGLSERFWLGIVGKFGRMLFYDVDSLE